MPKKINKKNSAVPTKTLNIVYKIVNFCLKHCRTKFKKNFLKKYFFSKNICCLKNWIHFL